MKLLEIYKSILAYCGMTTDEHGYVSTLLDEKREPAFIEGLRLVLPTDQNLRAFNPKESIIFHPLTENILRGESEVIAKLKTVINIRLNFTIGVIAQSLLSLVASPELHGQLNRDQREILLVIKDCDEKAVMNFISKMVSGIKSNPERLFVNIYLKRGGTFKNKRYSRVGIVTFPFYELIKEDKIDKIREKDKQTFQQLFEFMFPDLQLSEEYNFGSDSSVAPYLEALMNSSAKVASRLNDLLLIYEKHIEDASKLMFDADWIEYFKDLNALVPEIRRIPVQFGNDGTTSITMEPETQVAPAHLPQQMPYQQPGYPSHYPGVNIPAAAPVEVKQSKRGLDFKSMVQSNPMMAMVPNPLGAQLAQAQFQQQMMAMQQMQAQPPSWAQTQYPGMPAQGYPGQMPQMSPQQMAMMAQQQQMMTQQAAMMGGQPPAPSWAQPAPVYPAMYPNPYMR